MALGGWFSILLNLRLILNASFVGSLAGDSKMGELLLYAKFYFSVVLKFVNKKKESQSRGFSTVSPVKSFSWLVMGRNFSAVSVFVICIKVPESHLHYLLVS
jgi:hypothetical protein